MVLRIDEEAGFQIGNAAILEAVGAGGFESFVHCAVISGEFTDALFECGVLGGDPPTGILCPFGFQISDLAQEQADATALSQDLGVGGFESILGVESPLTPGRFT